MLTGRPMYSLLQAVRVKFYVPEEMFLLPSPVVMLDTIAGTEIEIEITPLNTLEL